jgi:hypothetical protein
MRFTLCGCCLLWGSLLQAADAPRVEVFLHSGEFDKGEQTLQRRLVEEPTSDQDRFGLGVLQFLRGVERLGQNLHQFGVQKQNGWAMFLRMPVPDNPDPAPISYQQFRRMLDDFRRDLELAESTLVQIKDEDVKLPLRLADIHFDLDHDGKATDSLLAILQSFNRGRPFDALKDNPQFLITFDRSDVAWLRAYCHLLMGLLDGYLGVNNEAYFNLTATHMFAKRRNAFSGTREEQEKAWAAAAQTPTISEPLRWARMRQHFLQAAALNRETWEFVRKETDNDSEWLPNPKQVSVLGLRVNDRMIDTWLALWDELDALFQGKKVMPYSFSQHVGVKDEKVGVNFLLLLDDPPAKSTDFQHLDKRYLTNDPEVDMNRLIMWYFAFGPSPIPMAIWFN